MKRRELLATALAASSASLLSPLARAQAGAGRLTQRLRGGLVPLAGRHPLVEEAHYLSRADRRRDRDSRLRRLGRSRPGERATVPVVPLHHGDAG